MGVFRRFSPVHAYKDLRLFLSHRQPYELGFLVLAVAITGFVIFAFAKDSHVEPVYQRKIIYVEQWPADRSDAQIVAQQKIDAPIEAKRRADETARQAANRATYKRLDDKMTAWGL